MSLSSADAWNTVDLATPVPMGTETIGADRTISVGFNYATDDGSALVDYSIAVFLETGTPASEFAFCWEDDPELWHDGVRGSRNRGAAAGGGARIPSVATAEYRTRTSVGNVGMPTADVNDAWPVTFSVDSVAPTDDSPLAIEPAYYDLLRIGIVEVTP